MALILRNGGSHSPEWWLKELRNNQFQKFSALMQEKWQKIIENKHGKFMSHILVINWEKNGA